MVRRSSREIGKNTESDLEMVHEKGIEAKSLRNSCGSYAYGGWLSDGAVARSDRTVADEYRRMGL